MQNYLDKIKQELYLRNYSPKTIKAYLSCLKHYFNFIKNDIEESNEAIIVSCRFDNICRL